MSRITGLLTRDRPLVMGILNVTPDSFSDGGDYLSVDNAVQHAISMAANGADIIDIGGESTRPGAAAVSADEELARVLPVISALRNETDIPISIDTSKAVVMAEAVAAGADLINDVRALQEPGSLKVASDAGCPVCLMHMQGEPRTMQADPRYDDVVSDVAAFFDERIEACTDAGIAREKIILDIGFGFGKTPAHNLELVNRLNCFESFELPLLVGLSRKSTIGSIVKDRVIGSVAGAVIAAERGASILRVHDVLETVEAIAVWDSVRSEQVRNWTDADNKN